MGPSAARIEQMKIPGVSGAESLSIEGQVTLGQVTALRASLLDAIEKTSATKLVLELSGIGKIDTSGAALLAEGFLAGRKRGIRVLLCAPSASVLRLFELAGFQDVLDACCSDPAKIRERLSA